MHLSRRLTLAAMSMLFLAGAAPREKVTAKGLVGTWTLVACDNVYPDGHRVQLYGPEPQGLLMFDGQGRYSLHILRAGRARFASNDKSQGTPEEYKAAVQGSNSHFGRYTVDGAKGTLTFHIDHASFPNWEGTQQQRTFTLDGDELTYTVPLPTSGGTTAVGEVKWRRANQAQSPAP